MKLQKKITEEEDNAIAKAFTVYIADLLKRNGIKPILTKVEMSYEECSSANEYQLVSKYGYIFERLDTTEHDKQIRDEVISEMLKNVEFEEKWLSDVWKKNGYNYSSRDIDIAFSGIKHSLIKMKGEQNE